MTPQHSPASQAVPEAGGADDEPARLPEERAPRPPLRRAADTPLAGVCWGLSTHLGLSVPVVRAVMIGMALAGGMGIVLYCWLWVFVPREDEPVTTAGARGLSGPAVAQDRGERDPDPRVRHEVGAGARDAGAAVRRVLDSLTGSPEVLAGGLLLGAAAILMLQLMGVPVDWWLIAPPALLVAGVLLAWSQIDAAAAPSGADGQGASTRSRRALIWQFSLGAGLVLVALLILAGGLVPATDLALAVMVAAMLLAGVALVVAPWVIRLYRTSNTERARAAAEAERADIAAHLHDSVLQTLAMIQKRREDPAAVEKLARGQERQLRSWLYGRPADADGSLPEQLAAMAAEVEDAHGVAVGIVSVGQSPRRDHRALVAASREAVLNAVRHAGPASVYLESDERGDTVYVRDRGSGFSLASVPPDRLGVRESIVGRMERAGGTASIRSTPEGTEVQLCLPMHVSQEAPARSARGSAAPSRTAPAWREGAA